MKKYINIIGKILMVSCMALSLLLSSMYSISVYAGEDYFSSDYTYTVRIYSGGQGTFSDGSSMILIKATPGTTISLTDTLDSIIMKKVENNSGELVESKYYPKGIRESGKDNNTVDSMMGPVFTITRDADYVVAYSVKGGDVAYTVKYIDEKTKEELAPTETFYGNVGEKPVVAYKFIDGYVPKAYNLAKTLKEDVSLNEFVFEYKKNDGSGYYHYTEDGGIVYVDKEGETIVERIPGKTVFVEGDKNGITIIPGEPTPLAPVVIDESRNNNRNNNQNSNAADNNAANNSNNAAIEESNNNEDEIAAGQEDVFEELEEESVPLDLIDLDDEDVALDMVPFFEVEGSKSLSKAIKIALIITIIAAMSLTGAFIVWTKRFASKAGLLNKAGKKEPKVKEKTDK
ncbi:MAG: hypothetical protein II193_09830 [Lachnospiraceae bacterium]|nr:hypothetical protein [Lachnospiraceae bacterium]